MPSDEIRRLLKTFGVAVTAYEDAVRTNAPMGQILESEVEARTRLQEVSALIERLGAEASARGRDEVTSQQ
jgi:hypothetical protein